MILFDEPHKYSWTIKYQILQGSKLETIIEGKCFDFIPRKGEIIVINNDAFIIKAILYDFDESIILVQVEKA